MKEMARDFKSVKAAADRFVKWANERFKEQDKDTQFAVEAALPLKRRRKVKNMPGEMAHDETLSNAEKAYEVLSSDSGVAKCARYPRDRDTEQCFFSPKVFIYSEMRGLTEEVRGKFPRRGMREEDPGGG